MKVSMIEEFLRWDTIHDPEEREAIHRSFPFVALVEGDFPELSNAERWCWERFGPRNGPCEYPSEYPGCPFVLATGQIIEVEYGGRRRVYKRFSAVPHHVHTGTWTTYFLGKVDYDYGFEEFCFSVEKDRDAFFSMVPTFTWGEHFDWREIGEPSSS